MLGFFPHRVRARATLYALSLSLVLFIGASALVATTATAQTDETNETGGSDAPVGPAGEVLERVSSLEAEFSQPIGPVLRLALFELESWALEVEQAIAERREGVEVAEQAAAEVESEVLEVSGEVLNLVDKVEGEPLTAENVERRNQLPELDEELEEATAELEVAEATVEQVRAELVSDLDVLMTTWTIRQGILADLVAELEGAEPEQVLALDERLAVVIREPLGEARFEIAALIAGSAAPPVIIDAAAVNRLDAARADGPESMEWPAIGAVNSAFGMRTHPIYGTYRMHTGIDIDAPRGSAVVAPGDGIVTEADWQGGYGRTVVIDHGDGVTTLSAHLSEILVEVGHRVDRGDVIGLVGATGTATDAHVHFEVRRDDEPIDPLGWLP